MKKHICILGIGMSLFSSIAVGQGFKFGGSLYYGIGGIKNQGQVQQLFDLYRARDKDISNMTITRSVGSCIGLEGSIAYYFTKQFSLNSGLQFQSQKNDVTLNLKSVTGQDGSFDEINSVSTISVSSVSIPVFAKYTFTDNALNPFFGVGLAFETRTNSLLSSNETINQYDASKPASQYSYRSFSNKNIDGLPGNIVNYVLGGGVDFKLASDHLLTVGLFYKANFQNSPFYVINIDSNNGSSSQLNKVYDFDKQRDIQDKYGIFLNDWRNSNFTLKIGFLF